MAACNSPDELLKLGHSTEKNFTSCDSSEFDFLTNDAVLLIFDYLSLQELLIATQVCRRWRSLIDGMDDFWNNVAVTFCKDTFNLQSEGYQCLKLAPFLKQLDLEVGLGYLSTVCPSDELKTKWTDLLSIVSRHRPAKVRQLRIATNVCLLREDEFFKLLRCFSDHLQELHLRQILIKWDDGQQPMILENFPKLEAISLDDPSSEFIEVNTVSCPLLQHVTLYPEDDSSFEKFLENHKVLRNLKDQLRRLDFIVFYKGWGLIKYSQTFLDYFPRLEYLSFWVGILTYFQWSRKNTVSLDILFKTSSSASFTKEFVNNILHLDHLNFVHSLTLQFLYPLEDVKSYLNKFPKVTKLFLVQHCSKCFHNVSSGRGLYSFIEEPERHFSSEPKYFYVKGCSAFIQMGKRIFNDLPVNRRIIYEVVKKCEDCLY